MKTKTKKEIETYAVYYIDLDNPDSDYEFDESFDSLQKAEEYIDNKNRGFLDDDNTTDWHWGFIIFKEIKNVRYTSKVNIQRTLVGEEQ